MHFQLTSILALIVSVSAIGTIQYFDSYDCSGESSSDGYKDYDCHQLRSYHSFLASPGEGEEIAILGHSDCTFGTAAKVVTQAPGMCVNETGWASFRLEEKGSL
ncbi:hypothetical protein NUU61_006779 [Penicillium alfredii]|uniref:Ecp2 effector protein domain-containing protein n=1 Tax=Penicillium alfredii TaxID=1506179 RepID=A0A9W9F1J7_9EURO|nr:uncharacterized protein NUU61_006779 [Penicillium alfredii]KAJ5091909.1 hypothetical protein NUU61_006779 [Penicillium alfredii]